jgi:hypothetical protein
LIERNVPRDWRSKKEEIANENLVQVIVVVKSPIEKKTMVNPVSWDASSDVP